MTRHYSGEMDSQITEQNYIDRFNQNFMVTPKGNLATMIGSDVRKDVFNFIQSLITSIKQEERERCKEIVKRSLETYVWNSAYPPDRIDNVFANRKVLNNLVIQSLTEEDVTNLK
jgi:hypothetical protein